MRGAEGGQRRRGRQGNGETLTEGVVLRSILLAVLAAISYAGSETFAPRLSRGYLYFLLAWLLFTRACFRTPPTVLGPAIVSVVEHARRIGNRRRNKGMLKP